MKNMPIGDIKPKEDEDEVQIVNQPSSSMALQDGSEQDKILPNEDVHNRLMSKLKMLMHRFKYLKWHLNEEVNSLVDIPRNSSLVVLQEV
ncbi:hypothetical protein U9M48_041362 [Paspalum notatum var. saurae]|uniref:Uncharacterized protein n=1 Tax=Paspalum notatum var. saurae TaxID=547442 RepID=A0AAQ3USZ7_PASNO